MIDADWVLFTASPLTLGLFVNVHIYVVPTGTILPFAPVGVTVNVAPLQIAVVVSCTVGLGLMVTVSVKGLPAQPPCAPEVGVTVYTTCCD